MEERERTVLRTGTDKAAQVLLNFIHSQPAALRGDNRMECDFAPDELSPVTIDDLISPVPMNPSCCIALSLVCRMDVHQNDLER